MFVGFATRFLWLSKQLLVNNFTFDSITITPKQAPFAPGVDYMTDYDEWLRIQVIYSIYIYIYI